MFDIGFAELMLVALVALLVLGPERLPKAARTVGYWGGRARAYMRQMTTELEREVQQAEIRETIEKTRQTLNAKVDLGAATSATPREKTTQEAWKQAAAGAAPAAADAEDEMNDKATLSAWERAEMEAKGTGPKVGEDVMHDFFASAPKAAASAEPEEKASPAQSAGPSPSTEPAQQEPPEPAADPSSPKSHG